MSGKPLISFIIPVYKTEQYLKKCLESLLDQDYPHIEIICVMDGKSKKAERIIEKHARVENAPSNLPSGATGYTVIRKVDGTGVRSPHHIQYLSIPHGGAPKARNAGVAKVCDVSDYLCFWDSDCYAEPGMVTKWMTAFEQTPDVDFVYEGYKTTETPARGIAALPFDEHLLTIENYISTCFPMRREVFPGFDESLQSLQDWDLWLTIIENGGKGLFLGGYSFSTEPPSEASISGIGCTPDNWLERSDAVKKKHGLPNRPVCFTTVEHHSRAIELAKCADMDYLNAPGYHPNRYRAVVLVGFHTVLNELSSLQHAERLTYGLNDGCKRYIYWVGQDVYEMMKLSFEHIRALRGVFEQQGVEHWCETVQIQRALSELQLDVEIVPMPILLDKTVPSLPKEPKVLLDADVPYGPLAQGLIRAMPDIAIETPTRANIEDYTGLVRLSGIDSLDVNCSRFIIQGRHVVSNIQQPHYGYVSLNGSPDETKRELIKAIRKLASRKKACHKASAYYRELLSPEKFERRVKKLCQS